VSAWRHARAIALLPGTAVLVVPAAILVFGDGPDVGWGLDSGLAVVPVVVGVGLFAGGLGMWTWTVRLLARVGQGTLAPWDPTRRLVVEGPYRHVRNPMITAVVALLLGEAAVLGSPGLLIWAGAFFLGAWVLFVVYEEPGLERRFGDEYREYKRHVGRWIPRRTAWSPHARN
jgi:protein-S-isoprenylcysteine O-methyltransferase Ste14